VVGIFTLGVIWVVWELLKIQSPEQKARMEAMRRRWQQHQNAQREAEHQQRQQHELVAYKDARRQWEYTLRSMSLTCERCEKLALPIPNTPDRYGCPHCNHQFVGPLHEVEMPPEEPQQQ